MREGDILVFYPPLLNRHLYFYVQKNVKRWQPVARMMNVVVIRNNELGRRLAARIVSKLGGIREAEPCLAGRALTREELAGLAAKLMRRALTEGISTGRGKVQLAVLRAKPRLKGLGRAKTGKWRRKRT